MNNYETLLEEAYQEGLIVKEKPLKYNNGRIKGNKIAIRKDLETTAEKACVLAEELGHYYTSAGDILDLSDFSNRKQEQQARLWAFNKHIGLIGLTKAYEHGCMNRYEVADYLNISEEFLQDALERYRGKYGEGTTIDNYYISFIPNLNIFKLV